MTLDRAFDGNTLSDLRAAVLGEAAAAGAPGDLAADVMLAVHELAANAVLHGAGAGRLAMRVRDGRLHCQVSDVGHFRVNGHAPNKGQAVTQPWPVERGHGLWLVQAIADHVSAVSGPGGSQVTAVFALPRSPDRRLPRVSVR